jgi:SAM-dependent methyltransferase
VDPGDDGGPGFAPGFFTRLDEVDDAAFYAVPRFVTHIDDAAIVAVGDLYDELRIDGDVLDLMSSWVSHFHTPLPAESVDDAVCCASVDYLTRPVAVFGDVARVLRPGGRLVCTFSNRVFATKAIRGWLYATDEERCRIVAEYFDRSGVFGPPITARRTPPEHRGDPLYAVWAVRREAENRR